MKNIAKKTPPYWERKSKALPFDCNKLLYPFSHVMKLNLFPVTDSSFPSFFSFHHLPPSNDFVPPHLSTFSFPSVSSYLQNGSKGGKANCSSILEDIKIQKNRTSLWELKILLSLPNLKFECIRTDICCSMERLIWTAAGWQ